MEKRKGLGKITLKYIRYDLVTHRAPYIPNRLKKGGTSKPTIPFKFYNNGNCILEGEHMDGHVLQKHACVYGYRMVKRFCYQSETSCNRKQMKGKKNDQ